METFLKFIIWLAFTLLCAIFGTLPELISWLIWHFANPQSDATRSILAVVLGAIGFWGAIVMAFMAVCFWIAGTIHLIEA